MAMAVLGCGDTLACRRRARWIAAPAWSGSKRQSITLRTSSEHAGPALAMTAVAHILSFCPPCARFLASLPSICFVEPDMSLAIA